MTRSVRLLLAFLSALVVLATTAIGGFASTTENQQSGEQDQHSCSSVVSGGTARCYARVRSDARARAARPARHGTQSAGTIGNGGAYDPAYLQSAYVTPSGSNGAGQTVAIVDAYDSPTAESDLASYRSYFGLPPCTSSGADPCFSKIDQGGGTTYPASDAGWAQEISLDLDMASAICPRCHLLLVEANSSYLSDLATAVNTAVARGANVVSNSYGGSEYPGETADEAAYNHPGIAITVSSGDNGYGVEFPAASQYVTAVGGTTLNQATNTGTRSATETAWSGAGSGCSAFEPKPSWQHDAACARRTVADVSAVADPNTGVWVYNRGWYIFGGTSVASPIVAAVFALAQNPKPSTATLASYPYSTPSALNDVTAGSNGSCGASYLCTGVPGYDGPTGLGTPNTATAFTVPGPPPARLSLGFNPSAFTAGASSAGTVTLLNADGTAAAAPPPGVSVNLGSSSAAATFAPSSTVNIAPGAGSGTFTYADRSAGNPVVTASATGWTSASAVVTVSAGAATSLTVTPWTASIAVGSRQTFAVSGKDAYGNAADVSGAAWSVAPTTLGAISCASSCSSTTFTAGAAAGSGQVSASLATGPSASAAVTVTAQGYTLSMSPSSRTVSRGSSTTYTVTIARTGGFTGAVTLSVNCPSNATCSWSSNPTTGSSVTLRVRTRSSTSRGTYNLVVAGTASGQPGKTASATLIIQ